MVTNAGGMPFARRDPAMRSPEEVAALRNAVKACYCGLGPACCHWDEMTAQGRVDCSRDKRASMDGFWKTGTAS